MCSVCIVELILQINQPCADSIAISFEPCRNWETFIGYWRSIRASWLKYSGDYFRCSTMKLHHNDYWISNEPISNFKMGNFADYMAKLSSRNQNYWWLIVCQQAKRKFYCCYIYDKFQHLRLSAYSPFPLEYTFTHFFGRIQKEDRGTCVNQFLPRKRNEIYVRSCFPCIHILHRFYKPCSWRQAADCG